MSEDNELTSSGNQEGVKLLLEVSRDEIEVHLTLIPKTQSPEFSTDKIRKALSEKGIVYGINEDSIGSLGKEIRYNEKVLLAAGTKPVEGKDGTIRYLVKGDGSEKVKIGEKIGEILPPEQGIEGITVFEIKIPVGKAEKAEIPQLINVELSEKEAILTATMEGYVSIDPSVVQVNPFFELKVSEDEYQAYIQVVKPKQESDFIDEDAKNFLHDNGIVYGILEEEIENIFSRKIYDQPVLVARGKEVVDDKDGEIKYLFETMTKPSMDENGNIDYKELNLIKNVLQDEKLAEIIPPVPGETGYTVFGEEIPLKKGEQPDLPLGKNTKPDPNNPNILVSEIDGCVRLKGTTVEVDPVFVVKENVDYSTGNISIKGSIVINGDVKSGFKVKAKGDVQINGVLEDGIVEAGGNVLLKNGFIGKGTGQIIARGDVTVKFCENETVIADGDIHISDYAMNSRIQTKSQLFVKDKNGLILGGESYAVKGIEANVVGNKSYNPTKLYVGVDNVTKLYLEKNIKKLEEIETILNKLSRRKLVKKELPEHMHKMIGRLNQITRDKKEENIKLTEDMKKIADNADELKKSVLKIHTIVYPGTWITIFDNILEVTEPKKAIRYNYSEEDIIATDI